MSQLFITSGYYGVGKPATAKTKLKVPLVVFTAFDVYAAQELHERLQSTTRPAELETQEQESKADDSPADIQENEDPPADKQEEDDPPADKQEEDDPPKDKPKADTKRASKQEQAQPESEPGQPEPAPDIDEREKTDLNQEVAWSGRDPYFFLDAADLSYYTEAQRDDLVREVAISLRHEKLILAFLEDPIGYLKHFATYTWDEESDEAADEFIHWYVDRFRAELEEQRELTFSGPAFGAIENTMKDQTNDERESVIAIDLDTGENLFLRYGDEDSVTLHEKLRKLVEERNIALLHNHPNNSAASPADLAAAEWLDAERMIVVNQDGTQHHYANVLGVMVPLGPTRNPDFAAPANPLETLAADLAYLIQTLSEIGNPAERVMEQEPNEEEFTINTDSRLVDKFLLNPATVVFLDDVANEYGVEDPSFFGAMASTIIYRELTARGSLENADNPAYQSNIDWFKGAVNLFSGIFNPIVSAIDGDPSFGIGAINREALARIEQDAQRLNMSIYAPLLGYDIPATLGDVPFSKGIHERIAVSAQTLHFVDIERNHQRYPTTVIPPSNEEHGAWRMQLAEFSGPGGGAIQQLYEPSLGLIAAEVAIAMQTPEYRELQTEEERIAYLIAFHANRSSVPETRHYDPRNFTEDTENEIQWATDFMELMNDIRTEIQSDAQIE